MLFQNLSMIFPSNLNKYNLTPKTSIKKNHKKHNNFNRWSTILCSDKIKSNIND